MNLYFDYYPKELVGQLKHSKLKNDVTPVMEVPDFKDNLSCLYSLISEFFLFSVRKNREKDVYLSTFDYEVEIPLDPLKYWNSKYPSLDLEKYDWFRFWNTKTTKELITIRKTLINLLAENSLITLTSTTPDLYKAVFSPYPQFEGLRQILLRVNNLVGDAGFSLFTFEDEKDIVSSLPHFFVERGLAKVGYNLYTINYTFGSEIFLNNDYLISKLNYGSINDQFFEYIFQFPKRKISKEQLEKVIGKLDRPISKIVYDIGFKGELKKLFFPKVSNNAVYFNNPVTQDDLLSIDLDKVVLLEQLKELKTVHSNTV